MSTVESRADVYISELDISNEVAQKPSSIGGIVGAFKRGRLGRCLITSQAQLLREYGSPDAKISFAAHCAMDFLEESSRLWVNRVVGQGAKWGGLVLNQTQPNPSLNQPIGPLQLSPASLSNPDINGIPWDTVGPTQDYQDNILCFALVGPGSYSKEISLEVVSNNVRTPTNCHAADFSTVGIIIAGMDASGTLPAGNYSYGVSALNSLGSGTPVAEAITALNGNVAAYISWDAQPGAIGYSIYRKNSAGEWEFLNTIGQADLFFIDKGYSGDGSITPPTTHLFNQEFTVRVYDTAYSENIPVETIDCTLLPYRTGLGEQLEVVQRINGMSSYVKCWSNVASLLDAPPIYSVPRTTFGLGSSGYAVLSSDIIRGWGDFEDRINVPVQILMNAGYSIPAIQKAMDALCSKRRDCVAILDTPSLEQKVMQATDYRRLRQNINNSRSALYTPDIRILDKFTNQELFVPPSGLIGGVLAYSDRVGGPQYAPAGMRRGGLKRALGLRHLYNEGEMNALKEAQINYVRNFPGEGINVFEQRTLQAMLSALSFLNVRRLVDKILNELGAALRFEEFEPNDDWLRMEILDLCNNYLQQHKHKRSLHDFLVISDSRNNTPYDAAQGIRNVDVLLKPIIAAETISLRGVITRQGANLSELASSGILLT